MNDVSTMNADAGGPPTVPKSVLIAELKIWHLGFERLIAFNLAGTELLCRDGTVDHVEPTKEDRDVLIANEVIVTHNHVLNRSFSRQDMNSACVYNIGVFRIRAPNFVYVLQAPAGGWDSAICKDKLFPRGEAVEETVRAELQTRVTAGELTPEEASALQKHEVWSRLAPELDFGYWREGT